MCEINGPKQGVFWVIQEKLFAFPFEAGKISGSACKVKGNLYPQKAVAYCLPERLRKTLSLLPQRAGAYCERRFGASLSQSAHYRRIRDGNQSIFRYRRRPQIHYEHTAHYHCHLDTEWRPES